MNSHRKYTVKRCFLLITLTFLSRIFKHDWTETFISAQWFLKSIHNFHEKSTEFTVNNIFTGTMDDDQLRAVQISVILIIPIVVRVALNIVSRKPVSTSLLQRNLLAQLMMISFVKLQKHHEIVTAVSLS